MTTTDTRGAVTHYNRGSIPGTLTNVVDGKGNTIGTYTYNGDGTIATASSEGVTTQINYNASYLPYNVVTPDGSATITYGTGTLLGKPISVTDNRSRTSTFTYDDWGRLTGTTRFDGAVASVVMSVIGDISSATDPLSHTTTLTRDGIGRTTAVQNARGDTEHYAFDSDGNLTSVQNGRGKYRYYFYTARSELKQIQFADSTLETYRFDGNGNQTQRINGLSQAINYGYDTTDNLTSVTYPTGTPTTFTYDYDGRQSTMVDSTGTSSWTYDNADNVTQLVTPQGTMQYAYDAWNRRSSLTEGTAITNYGYTNERLTSITKSADSVATTFSYDSYGRLVTKNDGATSTTYGYDGNDRVNSIAHANSSGTFHQETYNYDYVNNLTSKVVNSVATSYTYDAIDQLLTESQSGGYSYGYAYDHNGNRLTKTSGINVDTYTYDHADKLTSMTKPSGTAYYNYDNCGRLTSASGLYTRSFTWDYEDRMTSGTVYGTTATNYTYNGVGTRTAKSGPFGSRTYKRDGVGVTAPVLSDGIATMVPGISEKSSSGTSTVHTDRLGSMKAMSSSGSVTDTAEYDAFGNVLSRTGSSLTQKGFAASYGYQEDGESGLKLLGHRYYDPETGRFISRDRAYDGRNWYAYCENNPLKSADPTGLEIRDLTASEKGEYEDAADDLDKRGYHDEAKAMREALKEGKIKIDTELNAHAQWKFGTLYLKPSLFGHGVKPPKKTGNQRDDEKAYANWKSDKIWLESILLHEATHLLNSSAIDPQQYFMLSILSGEDEKFCWSRQFFFLSKILYDAQIDQNADSYFRKVIKSCLQPYYDEALSNSGFKSGE